MTVYETLASQQMDFGNHCFMEVSRKCAKDDPDATEATEFVAILRGYVDGNGRRRYRSNVTMPAQPEVIDFVREALSEVYPGAARDKN